MDGQEHIHIISAGGTIQTIYPAALRDIPGITHTVIIVKEDVYVNKPRSDPEGQVAREAVRDAIEKVKAIARPLGIPCTTARISPDTIESVRTPVLAILRDHPDARFSFDITQGNRLICLGLLAISFWMEGDAYYLTPDIRFRKVLVPKVPSRDILANQNYLTILELLSMPVGKGWLRETLFNEVKEVYHPIRKRGDGGVHRELQQATFSRFLSTLETWGLIRGEINPGSTGEKIYRITPEGEMVFSIVSARQKTPAGSTGKNF